MSFLFYLIFIYGMIKQTFNVPFDVVKAAESIGLSLKTSRKRRSMTQSDVAMRIGVSREVVINAEAGKTVSSHSLLSMLWLYGLLRQALDSVADDKDVIGMSMEKSKLPVRVRKKGINNDF
jgi:transcriptional regulator with XRE-family HTH domain